MNIFQNRIEAILEAKEYWFSSGNDYLANAVDRTVREGYFSFQDVRFALDVLEQSICKEMLTSWAVRAGLDEKKNADHQNVLCLHAGNLPLVGFQNAFATLLSGARYTGKISRKDPYLLPTFLNEVKKTALWSDMDVQWTHRLDDFEDMRDDRILFAGSETSVPEVRKAIRDLRLAKGNAKFLIRTSHFSMAYLDQKDEQSLHDLVNGMLCYGGKGCRSVAVVVAPFDLDEVKPELQNFAQQFWSENPLHHGPPPKLKNKYAYNRAVGRPQLWLKDYLIQQSGPELDQDFISCWVRGDEASVVELADQFGGKLQSIYRTDQKVEFPGYSRKVEALSTAQRPPIDWKPDGVDTLAWLID